VFAFFFCGYVSVLNICVMNVIVAIMVENVMKSTLLETEEEKAAWAAEKEEQMINEITKIFKKTSQGDMKLSRQEWSDALEDAQNKGVFCGLSISLPQLEMMFDVVDIDNSGTIDLDEFVDSLRYGFREVRSLDINAIQVDLWRMNSAITRIQGEEFRSITTMLQDVMGELHDLQADLLTQSVPEDRRSLSCTTSSTKKEGRPNPFDEKLSEILAELANLRADVLMHGASDSDGLPASVVKAKAVPSSGPCDDALLGTGSLQDAHALEEKGLDDVDRRPLNGTEI